MLWERFLAITEPHGTFRLELAHWMDPRKRGLRMVKEEVSRGGEQGVPWGVGANFLKKWC